MDIWGYLRRERRRCKAGAVELGTAPGVRAQKKARTRKALADAALDLFADRGFDETTVEDIAAACEVSSRTFFRYFAAKEDVLWAEADEYLTRLVDAISIRPRDEQPLRALRCAAVSLADAYEEEVERVALRNRVVAATRKDPDYVRSLGASEVVDRDTMAAESGRPLESARWAAAIAMPPPTGPRWPPCSSPRIPTRKRSRCCTGR